MEEAAGNLQSDGDRLERRLAALNAATRTPNASWSQSEVKVGRFTRSDEKWKRKHPLLGTLHIQRLGL